MGRGLSGRLVLPPPTPASSCFDWRAEEKLAGEEHSVQVLSLLQVQDKTCAFFSPKPHPRDHIPGPLPWTLKALGL